MKFVECEGCDDICEASKEALNKRGWKLCRRSCSKDDDGKFEREKLYCDFCTRKFERVYISPKPICKES